MAIWPYSKTGTIKRDELNSFVSDIKRCMIQIINTHTSFGHIRKEVERITYDDNLNINFNQGY